MKNFILILLLLISSFQFITSTRQLNHLSQRELQEFITILKEEYAVEFDEDITPAKNNQKLQNVDPNDHIDIELWNKLNDKDRQNMPEIKDYSDEATATHWLDWYYRIVQRYSQVRLEI